MFMGERLPPDQYHLQNKNTTIDIQTADRHGCEQKEG